MKSLLQLLLREKMKTTGVPSDEPYRRIYLEVQRERERERERERIPEIESTRELKGE
jgi:hypothetical protein